MNVYRELLEIAIEHYGGDAMKARADVKECMDKTKENLSDAEREFFIEKSGAFLSDGYNEQEADAEALDLILRSRPASATAAHSAAREGQGVQAQGRAPAPPAPQACKPVIRQNNLDGLKNYVKGRSA